MTLACEDASSKLFDIVTVADVDDEDHVGNSLLQNWKLRFSHKAKLCLDFELKFKRDFEAVVWSVFAADVWLRIRLQS